MKHKLLFMCFSFLIWSSIPAVSQQAAWPKTFNTNGSIAKLYEPQMESYQGDVLKIRAAISLVRQGKADPVFGVLWADVQVDNKSNNIIWQSATVSNIKFPGEASDAELEQLSADLQKELPSWNVSISKNDLNTRLKNSENETKLAGTLNNNPPKIIFSQKPSILVLIDGQPQLNSNTNWGVEQVTNTPFTLVKNTDEQYYLYGNKSWFSAPSINGPWSVISQLPSKLAKMDREVRIGDTSKASDIDNSIANIIVSTEPAELLQSKGEANFSPIEGTNLLYMSNTGNDIFLDVNSQQYYALISGRWYKSSGLAKSWTYTAADNLPADFAKIPEGSSKDVVLPNVAGTSAATESVMEAQVPQTARVDRKNAHANVTYDGDPQFDQIEGTRLKYAINTPGTVLNLGNKYYSVEDGVWFESNSATGPWFVATSRPAEVENIPPSYPVYNSKFVYIYDATPDYVYMGYTPGYLGNYIYGSTIVYGTGYYYKPWRGRHYYPRAYTWGFNMRYNPWTGWNFGLNYWGGWFSIGSYYPSNYWGGWWGPTRYRPCYYRPHNYNYGYYGRNVIVNNYTIINNNRSVNLYRNRNYVVTTERPGFNRVGNNGRSTPYNNYNNGRFNNGRSMSGNNEGGGNRNVQQQRPATRVIDGQVSRTYQPGNQQGRTENRSGYSGNNNNHTSERIVTPEFRNGRIGSSPREYTPGNTNRNESETERRSRISIDRSTGPVTSDANPRPTFSRPNVQNRTINPGVDNTRSQPERSIRVEQDRNFNPPPMNNDQRQRMERPSRNIEGRQSNERPASPPARMERPSQPAATSQPVERPATRQISPDNGGGTSRPERGSPERRPR